MVGELVKPDLLMAPALPPPTLQAMEEPPKPPDMQQLWEDLGLPTNDFLQKDPLIWKLIFEYQDIFSNTTPGCTDIVELQLHMKPSMQLICQKFCNLNPWQELELEAQLETWLEEGIIEPLALPGAAPWSPSRSSTELSGNCGTPVVPR